MPADEGLGRSLDEFEGINPEHYRIDGRDAGRDLGLFLAYRIHLVRSTLANHSDSAHSLDIRVLVAYQFDKGAGEHTGVPAAVEHIMFQAVHLFASLEIVVVTHIPQGLHQQYGCSRECNSESQYVDKRRNACFSE